MRKTQPGEKRRTVSAKKSPHKKRAVPAKARTTKGSRTRSPRRKKSKRTATILINDRTAFFEAESKDRRTLQKRSESGNDESEDSAENQPEFSLVGRLNVLLGIARIIGGVGLHGIDNCHDSERQAAEQRR